MKRLLTSLIGAALTAGIILFVLRREPVGTAPTTQAASTQTTTHPSAAPALAKAKPLTYIDAVRWANPGVPATQPLGVPVDLVDAAHVLLRDPVYVDPLGHLWIARADARPTNEGLRSPLDPPEHVIRDLPVFAHWWINDGDWAAAVVTRGSAPSGSGRAFEVITTRQREPLLVDRPFQWDRAFSWDGKIVVPTDVGISVIEVQPHMREFYHALPGMSAGDGSAPPTAPLAVLDVRGVIAWAPWDNGRRGSRGVSRFVDGNWIDLTSDAWAEKIVQLTPLLDGSVLQMTAGEENQVNLAITPLDATDIDRRRVDQLLAQLSDVEQEKREAAFKELTRYGPGLWPILEKVIDDQPAEGRMAVQALLRGKITPALGGMTIMENRLSVVNRQRDGIVLFYAPVGVRIGHGDRDPETISPAWIAIRPGGRVDRPLPTALIKDQRPDACALRAVREDWVLCDEAGVRRFIGNEFVPLGRPDERAFSTLLAVDRRGRWVLQRPIKPELSSTAPSTTQSVTLVSAQTLIVDPTILDPTPRLPVWTMVIRKGSVGWDAADFPCIKRGGAWALKADEWEPLAKEVKMITELPALSAAADDPPTTAPSTTPSASSSPTTSMAIDLKSLGPPLRVTAEGVRYYDGRTSLVMVEPGGNTLRWRLPPLAVGHMDPTLIRTADGRLFLFNEPGRVLRIAPTPGGPEPFVLEATFTKDVPNSARPTRIWLDPLGRINVAFNGNMLAVMFPSGHIPPGISQMMVDGGE